MSARQLRALVFVALASAIGIASAQPAETRDAGTPSRPAESVTVSKVEVEGNRSREEVAASLEQLRPQVHDCYLKALQRKPDLQGKLELRWTIDAGGSVGSLKLSRESLNTNEVAACALTRLRHWKFPASSGEPAAASCTIVLRSNEQ